MTTKATVRIEWRMNGEDWHLLVGNQSVVRLIPDATHPRYPGVTFWVSDINEQYCPMTEDGMPSISTLCHTQKGSCCAGG